MTRKIATSLAAALLLGAAACTTTAIAAQFRGGGGGFHGGGFHGGGFHGGGMHFGGGGMHFGGAGHFGGGGMHFGGLGARSMHFAAPHFASRNFAAPHFAARHFAAPTGQANRFAQGPRNGQHPVAGSNAADRNVMRAGQNRPMANAGANALAANRGARAFNHDPRAFQHGRFGWRNFHRGYVGWGGPVFWPYAYDDLFDYAYWPYGDDGSYDDLFWAYGYDDLFAGVLLPNDYASFYGQGTPQPAAATAGPLPASSVAQLCGSAPMSGGSPIDRIANAVQPNPDQRAKLDALAKAETGAAKELRASCATQTPTTAVGRLDEVQKRVQDMLAAVNTVRGPLDDFYSSLTDEQKARFNALGAGQAARSQGSAQPANLAEVCGPQNAIPVVSVGQIDKAVQPNPQQRADLIALQGAANKADDMILATCPKQAPLTPPARLDAARDRLQAMLQAVDTVRPALQNFYASLGDQQKARFDAMNEQPPADAKS